MRAAPAYIAVVISKGFHPLLSRKNRFKLQHKITISPAGKHPIARGVSVYSRFCETGLILPANIPGYGHLSHPSRHQNHRNCPTASPNFPDVASLGQAIAGINFKLLSDNTGYGSRRPVRLRRAHMSLDESPRTRTGTIRFCAHPE